jgi:uncharacterized Zn-binding protein involved in type VI secretion
MGKPIVVENDKVEGTDKHNVTGKATNPAPPPPPTVPYAGVGDFDYVGKMTDQLSDFVSIDGQPVALKSSKSSLNPGESATPTGRHSGPMGKNFMPPPPPPAPIPATLQIPDPIGEGKPSVTAGSSFVKVNGVAILLDGDKIDTCDGTSKLMNSTVTAEQQSFVACSE